MAKKAPKSPTVGIVSASRAGHTFHERWAARRAMQLVFPSDRLKAIAIEGLSKTETADPGAEAEDVADLALYYGDGDNFATSEAVQTAQFKYRTTAGLVTASYLRKTDEAETVRLLIDRQREPFDACEPSERVLPHRHSCR